MNRKEMWENTNKNKNIVVKKEEIIEEPELREITFEEKQEIKKIMVMLIWGVLIVIFGYILIKLFVNFIDKEEKVEIKEEPKEEVREVLPDGEIEINNKIIQEIDKMFVFDKRNPLYETNILKLFGNERKEVEELDFQSKMLLITSNNTFNDYMLNETNLKKYKTKEVSITKKKLEELSKDIFGRDINLQHQNFKYYYIENNNVVYFNATLKDDKYIFIETTGQPSTIEVYKKMVSAYKISNEIFFQYRVVFIKNNKVYSDVNTKNIVSNDINNINNTVYNGYAYEYAYNVDIESNNLYLLKYIKKRGSSEEK